MQLYFLILHPSVVYTGKRFICLRIFYLKVIIIIFNYYTLPVQIKLKKEHKQIVTIPLSKWKYSETNGISTFWNESRNWWRKLIYEFTLLNYETIVVVSLFFCLYFKKTQRFPKPTVVKQIHVLAIYSLSCCECVHFIYIILTYILQKMYTIDEWIFGWKCSYYVLSFKMFRHSQGLL